MQKMHPHSGRPGYGPGKGGRPMDVYDQQIEHHLDKAMAAQRRGQGARVVKSPPVSLAKAICGMAAPTIAGGPRQMPGGLVEDRRYQLTGNRVSGAERECFTEISRIVEQPY